MTQGAATTVRVAENGRLSLPAKQRRQVGIENGGVVVIRVEDGEIRIKSVQAVVQELQSLASKYFDDSGETVDRFLSDRHEEEAKEY